METRGALGESRPSRGWDGEDFTSPAPAWLLAQPLLVPWRCRENGAEGSQVAGQAEF